MVTYTIKLESRHLEYLKRKNIDISEFTRSAIDKLIADSKKEKLNPETRTKTIWH